MKDHFPDFYLRKPSEEVLSKLIGKNSQLQSGQKLLDEIEYPSLESLSSHWDDCLFVFDANSLCHAYQMPKEIRIRFFEILDRLKERIRISHHAAKEYHENILNSIAIACKPFKVATDLHASIVDSIKSETKEYGEWHWFNYSVFDKVETELKQVIELSKYSRDDFLFPELSHLRALKKFLEIPDDLAAAQKILSEDQLRFKDLQERLSGTPSEYQKLVDSLKNPMREINIPMEIIDTQPKGIQEHIKPFDAGSENKADNKDEGKEEKENNSNPPT